MLTDEAELAVIEEHLTWCSRCIDAAEEAAQYVDAMRAAIIRGDYDLEELLFRHKRWRTADIFSVDRRLRLKFDAG
jgi:hypothetical protein